MSNEVMNPVYRARLIKHRIGILLSTMAMGIGIFFLLWILYTLLSKGLGSLDLAVFTQSTPPPGDEGGGLMNAILGSLMMVGFATLISTPIGILAGIYLAEFGENMGAAHIEKHSHHKFAQPNHNKHYKYVCF